MASSNKTPVTILQELLCKRGTMPKYELVQIEGAIHEPTFRYRVTFGDYFATGTGRSKKEAKHAAARNILYRLVGNVMEDDGRNEQQPRVPSPRLGDRIPGNPIGTLQEMCMARHWPPPCYELTEEEGLPHERRFTIECKLLHYREVGVGKSKKLAKRKAANKMWKRLQACNGDLPAPGPEVPRPRSYTSAQLTELNLNKVSVVASPKSPKVASFHTKLRRCTGEKLNLLHTGILKQPGFDFVQFLKDIAFEQQFQLTFVDIDELSITGLYQCLVQLSASPIAVCYGCGEDMEEAYRHAAENALEYLRVMTEKPPAKPKVEA